MEKFSAATPCRFSDLKIGDKVQIKHYHLYKDGYWQLPSVIDYKYIGTIKGAYYFQNAKYPVEHFRMTNEFEDNHVFMGKYTNLPKTDPNNNQKAQSE